MLSLDIVSVAQRLCPTIQYAYKTRSKVFKFTCPKRGTVTILGKLRKPIKSIWRLPLKSIIGGRYRVSKPRVIASVALPNSTRTCMFRGGLPQLPLVKKKTPESTIWLTYSNGLHFYTIILYKIEACDLFFLENTISYIVYYSCTITLTCETVGSGVDIC